MFSQPGNHCVSCRVLKGGLLSSCRSASLDSLHFSSHCFLHSTSAEAVAMGLLKQFEGMQLPAASELEWLVPEHDAPQKVGSSALLLYPPPSPRRLLAFLILFFFVIHPLFSMNVLVSFLTRRSLSLQMCGMNK